MDYTTWTTAGLFDQRREFDREMSQYHQITPSRYAVLKAQLDAIDSEFARRNDVSRQPLTEEDL